MIYLFNQTEKLIDVIDEASLADFTHTIELNQFDRANFEIPVDYKPNIIKEAQFFGFQSRDRAFCLFRISEKYYDIGLTIQGIDRAESDLHSFIIEDKRPGETASDVLREILKGTGYQLGDIDGLTINGNMSFYYISVRQALVKLIESYACEFRVRYTFVENKIIGRYIDLNQRFGRKTGHQFEYGSNILNIIYEESSDEVVTALIGRGKGEQSTDESGEATGGYGRRIQFKDVSWSVAKGDPVDKPAGQNYVANETARNIYGLHQNGVIKHRFGVYTNEDIEDPVELLKATYKELQRLSIPIVTFKANLLDLANAIEQDVWIGDSVGIVRDQIGIAFEARIHKLIIDKLDDNRSVVELGDYQTLQAKDRSTRQQAIKDAVSGFSEGLIEEAIANEVERRNKEFDEKIRVNKLEFDNELKRAKERAEEIKRQITDEIDKKFQSFDNTSIQEAKRRAEEALRNAGASSLLAQEAKNISERARTDITNLQASSKNALSQIEAFKTEHSTKLNEVKSTADGLFTKMGVVETYISKDGQRQESLQRYARDESARQVSAIREQISRDYVGKSTYQEDVRGLERRFSAISTQTDNDIATKISQYKQTVDGQFASIRSQVAGKANQVDFQRVRETSQLYERILGNTENGIADKVARMAMTNQLFQVEVGKAFADHQNLFLTSTLTKGFLGNAGIIYVANATQKEVTSDFISVDPNEKIIFQHWVTLPENGMAWTAWQFFDKNKNPIDNRKPGLNAYKTTVGKQHNINQITVPTNAYFIRVSARMYNDGLIKIERGSAPSNYSAAPEDTDEAIRTVQTQLAGSWGVHNKNSVNEIIAGFNLAGRNAGIKAETIRLEGNTLADKLTAIDGYFKRLFVGEGTFATLNADVIRTNSITADKLVFNEALANRMVSNEHITNKLVASRAFVNALKAVTIDASQIVTGTLKGDRIYGGTIRGTEINGTTITGNSRMTIGDNGFLRPTQEGGLQINVPETYSASKGVGVQLLGRELGRIPKGMFIYNSPNWNGGNIIGDNTEDILLTVKGRVSLCNLHNGSPVSGVPIISNFEYQNPIRNLYPIRFIGWDPRSNQLYVDDGTGKSGTWWISVDGSTSDKNLKTNIGDTHYNALDFVQKLMFKEFDWKTDKFGYKKPYTNVGLIAQDVEKIDSSLVYKKGETLALDDFRLLNIALKAIQELALENRKLTHRLENLENERRTA